MTDVIEAESSTATETENSSDDSRDSSPENIENQDVNTEGSSPDDKATMVDAITQALEEENPETVGTEPDEEIPGDQTVDEAPSDKKEEDVTEASGEEKKSDLHDMPEGLKPKAEERFQTLVNDNKQKSEYISQATEALTNMQTAISRTGLDAESFGGLLDFAKMANSQNPQDQEQAFNIVKAEYERQAQNLGKKIEGFDSLANHPDLRDRVDDLELTEDDALKLAHAERLVQRQDQMNRDSFETNQKEEAAGVERKTALDSVGVFMESMEKTDIDFSHKNSKLMGMVDSIRSGYPPTQWVSVVKHLYGVMGTSSDKRIENKKSASNPVVSSGASAGSQVPQTMLEAMNQALDG